MFWSFRIMVALGLAMLAVGLWSLLARFRGRLYDWSWLHRAAVAMGPSGLVAVIAGWVTTEVGRQPFTVYGLMRTSESASPLDAPAVATSLVAFIIVYFCVFGAGIYYLLRLMGKPPQQGEAARARHRSEPPNRDVASGNVGTAGRQRRGSYDGNNAFARRAAVLHAADDFLSDVAALGERDGTGLIVECLVRKSVAEFEVGTGFRHTDRDAHGVVIDKRRGFGSGKVLVPVAGE